MRPFLARNTIFLPLLFLVLGIIFKEWTEIGWAVLIVISFFLVLLTYFYNNFKYLLFIPLGIAFASHPPADPNSLELLTDKKADIEGTLFRPIERKERSSRLYVHIRQAFVDYQKHDIDLRVIVTIDDQLYGIYKGHRIRILGVKLKEFRNYENPGGFDVKKFYERKQIYLTGFIDNKSDIISFGQQSSLNRVLEYAEKKRENFLRFIRANILWPNSEVYAALTIGEKKGIPFELRNNFSSLGISHLLAISGLHLGAIALIFYLIFDWLIKRSERLLLEYNVPKITAALTIVPIIFYMFLSGFATPVIRATIMAVIYLASIIIGRPHFKLNTLFSAAFIILIIDPTAIFDLSFRLSFMSVLGILAIHHFYPLHIHSFKDKLFTSLKTTAIATVSTLPLIINSFGILSLLAVPANLIFIPLVEFIIIPMGLISFIIFNISTSASLYVIELNNQLIGFFISYVQSLASLSLASITVPYLNSLSTTLYYLSVFLIFFTLSAKTKRLQFITLIFVMGFICSFSFGHFMNWKYKNFEAYILDSGARNTVLIKTKSGSDVLILSGSSRFNQNGFIEKNIVTSFLLKSGVSGLEYIILTEINEDILEGAAHLIRKFGVKYIWTNGAELNSDIWEEIKSGKVKWLNLQRDYEPLHLGNVKLEILFPKLKNSKFNQYSAADVLISHNNKYFLISNNPVDSQILVNTPAEIIFWPYIKNEALLNKVLSSSATPVLITKQIDQNISWPPDSKIYQTSKQGMVKFAAKNSSLHIITHIR